MILTLEEAKLILRVDDDELDEEINALIIAIPEYLETTTGKAWNDAPISPLAHATARFILQLWFDPQIKDSERLKNMIEGLLGTLTAMGRGN